MLVNLGHFNNKESKVEKLNIIHNFLRRKWWERFMPSAPQHSTDILYYTQKGLNKYEEKVI